MSLSESYFRKSTFHSSSEAPISLYIHSGTKKYLGATDVASCHTLKDKRSLIFLMVPHQLWETEC